MLLARIQFAQARLFEENINVKLSIGKLASFAKSLALSLATYVAIYVGFFGHPTPARSSSDLVAPTLGEPTYYCGVMGPILATYDAIDNYIMGFNNCPGVDTQSLKYALIDSAPHLGEYDRLVASQTAPPPRWRVGDQILSRAKHIDGREIRRMRLVEARLATKVGSKT